MLAWGIAASGSGPTHGRLFEAVSGEVAERLEAFTVQGLTTTLWAACMAQSYAAVAGLVDALEASSVVGSSPLASLPLEAKGQLLQVVANLSGPFSLLP